MIHSSPGARIINHAIHPPVNQSRIDNLTTTKGVRWSEASLMVTVNLALHPLPNTDGRPAHSLMDSKLEEHNTPKRPILAFKALLQTLLKFVFILFAGTLPKRLVRFHHWSPRPLALTQAKPQTLPHVLNRPSQQPSL
ncbi:hypothetical protein FOVSG1_001194 [Fusarium oxysporum f. sp. vasinfectum]